MAFDLLDLRAQSAYGKSYDALGDGDRAKLQAELKPLIRANTYDAGSGTIVISAERAQALAQVAAHYNSLFSNAPGTRALRETYERLDGALLEHAQGRGWGAPRYEVLAQEGPEHGKRYVIAVRVRDEVWGEGEGASKKEAEQAAARDAIEHRRIPIDESAI